MDRSEADKGRREPQASALPRALVVSFEATRALIHEADLAELVDELADGHAVTSALVGPEGTPSRAWTLFREVVGRASREDMCALLSHRSPVVRAYVGGYVAGQADLAEEAYGLLGDTALVRTLVGTLSATETVGSLVLKALVRSARAQDGARHLLVEAAADERLPRERRLEALEQAAALGVEEARAWARSWATSVDAELRAAGLRALAKIGTLEDLPMARQAAHDPRPGVRFAAAEALRLALAGDDEVTRLLEHLLEDSDPGVRAAAIATYAYRPFGREERLAAILRGSKDLLASGVAAVSLLAAGDDVALAVLEPWLMEPLPGTLPARFWTALAQVDDIARAPFMRRLLDSRAELVRTTAMRFLGEAHDEASEPLLRRALDSLRPGDRATATTALARLGARTAVPDIAGRLRDVSDNVRAAAARALADLGAREAMSDLVAALGHEKLATVREAIMEALNALETRGPARAETWGD